MTSHISHYEVIVGDSVELTSIQLDEKHHVIYELINYQLIRNDFNNKNNNVQIVCEYHRRFQIDLDTNDDVANSLNEQLQSMKLMSI